MVKCEDAISSFHCTLDPDIESFLKIRSVKYNRLSKGKTFLLISEDGLINEGRIIILAYFTVTLSIIHVPAGFSGNQIKKLDGLSANYHGERLTEFPCYLIGQLAKNDNVQENISGDEIIAHALSIVSVANSSAGGRYVLVDVKPVDKLVSFYRRNSFEMFNDASDTETNEPMLQMMRAIF